MNPQTPLHLPSLPFALSLPGASPTGVESLAILLLFIIWVAYTLVVAYHWIAYGGFTHRGIPALAVHILVSATIFLYAVSGIS